MCPHNFTTEFFTFAPHKYISTGVTSDSITIFWKRYTQDKLGLLLFLQEMQIWVGITYKIA